MKNFFTGAIVPMKILSGPVIPKYYDVAQKIELPNKRNTSVAKNLIFKKMCNTGVAFFS